VELSLFKFEENFGKAKQVGVVRDFSGHRSIKYLELFGTISSITAGLTANVINYTVPDGHCAELYAIGVQPDYDPATQTSNLLCTEIGFDDKSTGIKFLTNHRGKNSLPYGDRASKQPIRMLDFPMRRDNLTVKYNSGMKLQIKCTAGGSNVTRPVNIRAQIILYEPKDVAALFGASISNFATLPGGVSQDLPKMLFADYVDGYSTTSRSRWENAYSKRVMEYEQINLTMIGVCPHANGDSLKIYDSRLKWEAPEFEPYYKINEAYNALPFGDDDDYMPTARLPVTVASHVFTNTDMIIQVRDNGAGASTQSIQLFGIYRRFK
jgi:hypothetical protein